MSTSDTVPVDDGGPPQTVRVYEPGARSALPFLPYLRSLWGRRKFIVALAGSELKARDFNTVLGQLWLVLEPLMLAGVYFLLVGILRGSLDEPGRLQLIVSGVFLFTFTRTSIQAGSRSIVGNGRLLMNSSFPRALLPASAVLQAFFQLLPSLFIYAVIHGATQQPVGVGLATLPGLLILHGLFNVGAAMIIAMITVYFREMQTILGYLLRLWLYVTPVLYPITDLRGNLETVLDIIQWNPLFHLFVAYQRVLDGGFPTTWQVLASSAWAIGTLVLGFVWFVRKERAVAIRL